MATGTCRRIWLAQGKIGDIQLFTPNRRKTSELGVGRRVGRSDSLGISSQLHFKRAGAGH